MTNNITIALLG